MPMRRSLNVLNSTRDLTMGRGQIGDNVVQRSPHVNPFRTETDHLNEGRIVDNVVQRSPCVSLNDIDDEFLIEDRIDDDCALRYSYVSEY